MKVAVIAANGKAAGKIITEAMNRGFEVTAFGSKENNTDAKNYVKKDLFDITTEDLKGFDAVVDAFGAWTEDTLPDAFKPLAKAMATALTELRERNDVKWTYISPAGDFQADGERSGKYILGGEELVLNSKGESIISYADYAIAMVDEIEKAIISDRESVL